jgi:glucose-6-phosphate isomerase, archaeal
MMFDPGLNIRVNERTLGFTFGPGIFAPPVGYRMLDAIRPSLRDPDCTGPDPVYAIAMDVGKSEHREELQKRMLLYGLVTYAAGRLGKEPVRSQGHVHCVAAHSGWVPPEIYEIWAGRAVVYMQEFAADDPGRCFAVTAGPGDIVVVPPGWAHGALSASQESPLTLGAWCDRDYGFQYDEVRARRGFAWYALLNNGGQLEWQRNPRYVSRELIVGPPDSYQKLSLQKGVPIYTQFERNPETVQWVSEPARMSGVWPDFVPCTAVAKLSDVP